MCQPSYLAKLLSSSSSRRGSTSMTSHQTSCCCRSRRTSGSVCGIKATAHLFTIKCWPVLSNLKPTVCVKEVFGDTSGTEEEVFVSDVKSILPLLKYDGYDDQIFGWSSGMRRRNLLKARLSTIKNAHMKDVTVLPASLSSVRWGMIEHEYKTAITPYAEASCDVPGHVVEAVAAELSKWKRGPSKLEKARSVTFTDVVKELLREVDLDQDAKIKLKAEVGIDSEHIMCHGRLDFAILKGDRQVGVVEMKTSDMTQGKTQAVLGCEAVRKLHNLPEAIGIVSTLEQWTLIRFQNEKVLVEEGIVVDFDENGNANNECVKILADKLLHLLTVPMESSPPS